ncbi:MAG: hybrid sensor histidine kinase/response regulator [Spirulinaceae cyanobacterium SM2_1_0]|nr:hybrid sensor histidine kinase/response regulator [Spirulinaceae cyanobacterium SM2_1_0]
MFIEDAELRSLFKTASTEHLQNLEAGLLRLEQQPDALALLPDLLREAHSLKGDARMLGVKGIETLSHQVEHFLEAIARQELTLTPELSDRLYQSFDAMRQLVQEATTGEPSSIDTFRALANLMGASAPPASSPIEAAEANPPHPITAAELTLEPETTAKTAAPETAPPAVTTAMAVPTNAVATGDRGEIVSATAGTVAPARTPPSGEPYRIETIRVATSHLDDLMTQAGELTVTKIRMAHVATEIEHLAALWEEWQAGSDRAALTERLTTAIQQLRTATADNSARLEAIAGNLEDRIRTLRLLPLANVFQLFPRLVRDLARSEAKLVELVIEGGDTNADKRILEAIKDPLMHLIRNAIDHGIESPGDRERQGKPRQGTVKVVGSQTASTIIIAVSDDGRGLDLEKIKQTAQARNLYRAEELAAMSASQIYNLIFLPGFSTQTTVTTVSGRGVGLDVVQNNIDRLKGSIQVESTLGQGTTFRIQLSTTLATANVLLVEVRGQTFALPVEFVQTSLLVARSEIFTLEGCQTIAIARQAVSIAVLAELLELPAAETSELPPTNRRPCILLRVGGASFGLLVDALIDTQDVMLKPQSQLLKRVRNIAGATILGTGEVCTILNPVDLLRSLQRQGQAGAQSPALTTTELEIATSTPTSPQAILLVEDSIAIRTKEKRILEAAGYEVVAAVDGRDGLKKLPTRPFAAVISDVQMPNLDGLELTRRIRQQPQYNELPIILVTSLAADADKRRGVEAGANAYITKDSFNREILLTTLQRLL